MHVLITYCTRAAPAPVIEHVSSSPAAADTAPTPVNEFVAPSPAGTHAAPAPVMDIVAYKGGALAGEREEEVAGGSAGGG